MDDDYCSPAENISTNYHYIGIFEDVNGEGKCD